ncbi:MAG: hypothetical protein AB7T10_08475 [bacterium]
MKNKHILAMLLIVTALTSTSCLSMIYYPSRVLDKGGIYIGLGTHVERRWDWGMEMAVYSSLYSRFGFGGGFDGGIELRSAYVLPYMIAISARKQFNFNAIVIDGVSLGGSVGFLNEYPIEWNGNICFLKKAFSLTIGTAQNHAGSPPDSYSYRINSTYARAAYEFTIGKHFIVMPFVSGRHSNTYKIEYNGEILDFWQRNQMGVGLSIAFKSK